MQIHQGKAVLVAAALIMSNAAIAAEPVATLTGVPHVKEGDYLMFGDIEVRLEGIAAPRNSFQKRDPGGPAAAQNLAEVVKGKEVTCKLDGTFIRNSNRLVGVCFMGSVDIGEYLVKTGRARDCPRYSENRYAAAEAAAQADGKDLSATFELPKSCTEKAR